MSENGNGDHRQQDELYSKVMRAGRRTYFFDVRETRAGDYFLTITESKKSSNEDGSFYFKKHKIYLYKEDFENFKENLEETTNFILQEKGAEVISEKHQTDYVDNSSPSDDNSSSDSDSDKGNLDEFTDLSFEDI